MPPSSGNQISAWELVAHITVEGDSEAKQKLKDFTADYESSQERINKAGSGGGRGRGRSKMTRDDFLGTDDQWNSSEAREARGETGQGSKAVRNAAPRYLSAPPGGAPILMPGALLDAKNAAKWQGFSGPSLPSRMLPNAADQAQLDAAEQAREHAAKLANSGNAPGLPSRMLQSIADAAEANARFKPAAGSGLIGKGPIDETPAQMDARKYAEKMANSGNAPGLPVAMNQAGLAFSGFAGGSNPGQALVGKGKSENEMNFYSGSLVNAGESLVAKSRSLGKKLDKAGDTWSGYSIGLAYAARHVLAGGGGGMIGGALGTAIGAFGGAKMAYLGMIGGSAVGEFADGVMGVGKQTIDKYGKFSPMAAYQRQRAEANAEAAEGSNYRGAYQRATKLEQEWADFSKSGTTIAQDLKAVFGDLGTDISKFNLEFNKAIKGVSPVGGSGIGAAISPQGGRIFHSINEAYMAAAQMAIMAEPKPPELGGPQMPQGVTGKLGAALDYLSGQTNVFTTTEDTPATGPGSRPRPVAGNMMGDPGRINTNDAGRTGYEIGGGGDFGGGAGAKNIISNDYQMWQMPLYVTTIT